VNKMMETLPAKLRSTSQMSVLAVPELLFCSGKCNARCLFSPGDGTP